ncbi:hypothetical protein CcaverHIS002_0403010 [Cutaneotrichosporon cavernicola]|uniref:Phospholipid/glycerol acyltransferase domain-containing protein n=1 Tax=Cutaneotrichosporon cavernicola TaxID=279322 RepID=A0AA48L3W9_9TREE|nr:uncharacterized protein CcaverHIS019_0402970 [Cutaneotrichosporon cavernicola]BEI83697.1 hypothetical protein CcaverHIS002_0403010 [Cutaneotrichosporon cavernicola]BEI91477.1 hypothetical protein CcaverHIS019_0402970 [Cutaneotrichosporon cavernicola]BEI99252.1 hypothetical protein CcaverHIS631_0402950 [Cutaneotrichosporon cavernicola]BEJ07029.1 hypothetical protein CcaverHIS641_0402980 [Cutaneotrichosporon cavernicola]
MPSGLFYDFFIVFWRLAVLNIFFREIRPRGAWNIPKKGPLLFIAAPHANQFLDPLVLFSEVRKESGRRVSMLTAAKSMDRKFIGAVARAFHSIPVSRAADYAKTGTGKVMLDDSNGLIVRGVGTTFTKQVQPRSQILLPKSIGFAQAAIDEVISDTELRLKSEFTVPSKDGNSNVKATSRVRTYCANKDGSGYKLLPHVDQEQTYGAVFDTLNKGNCIGIFPEGGSHDRTDFLPLKAGFSIMALGAMAANPDLDVKLVPVGLSYFHAHKFRSRAVIEFGAPISCTPELVNMYKEGGAKKREACGKLLEQVHDALRTVTLRAPDWETLQVVQAARRLYRVPGQSLTLGQVVQLSKHFMEGYLHYQHDPRVVELRERTLVYNRKLRDMGIADHQVERASNTSVRSLLLLIYRTGLLLWWGLLSLPGGLLHAPVFTLAKIISHQKAKEALAASTVKIQARDVLATWKVLVSLAITPLLYLVYALAAQVIAYKYDLIPEYRRYLPLFMFAFLPSLGYSALKFGEAGMDVFKSLRPLFLSVWPWNHHEIDTLRTMREELSEDINEVIAEFGPKLYDNFEKSRYMPSAKSPRSRVNNDSVLSHPINWLDDRIFGWNRRGSAVQAWENASTGARSEPGTAPGSPRIPGSPRDSDDEEEADVDYDDILAVVDMSGGRGASSPRRRAGRSYSDLTQMRKKEEELSNTEALQSDYLAPDAVPEHVLKSDLASSINEEAPGLHQRKPYPPNGANTTGSALGLDRGE